MQAIMPSGRSVRNAAVAHVPNPIRIRKLGDGSNFSRGVSRLNKIPPMAIAAITAFKCDPAIPRKAIRLRNANCAKIRK
jgi:hypothetical protein